MNKLFIRLEMDAMMDRIFICEQEQHYATKKLIPNPASSIIPCGKKALHCDVIQWNKQHITAAGPLAQLYFILMDSNVTVNTFHSTSLWCHF